MTRIKEENEELIKIEDGKYIKKKLLRHWTNIAKECYNRGCNCNDCNIVPLNSFHEECHIKDYVKGYFLLGIYPYNNNEVKRNDS